jgi:hypothetical protein
MVERLATLHSAVLAVADHYSATAVFVSTGHQENAGRNDRDESNVRYV